VRRRILLTAGLVALIACHASPRPAAPSTGGIAGDVLDRASGAPVRATLTAHGTQSFAVASAHTAGDGHYAIDGLAPGVYDLIVELPGTTLQLTGIPITGGHITALDVPIDPGAVEVPPVAFEQLGGDAIRAYQPPELHDRDDARLEGSVTDTVSLERVAGAVVTATSPVLADALNVVSDSRGRFRFERVPPGTYTVSAYYNVDRRGQIEVRRSDIAVVAGTAVIVPMFVEVSGTE